MLKALLKKQLFEFGRSFIYDEKKKKARSKLSTIAFLTGYLFLLVGVLGGVFTFLAVSMCKTLFDAGVGWLYYAMFGLIGIALGTFGSVFNTFATLYSAKDNDLLLSMPIPEKYIVISRLLSVYILGAVFAGIVTLPAVIVAFVTVKQTVMSVLGGLIFVVIITGIILFLSCALGFVVAKISAKIKNKSFITVLASLVFFGVYYFCYFKANDVIKSILANAAEIGSKIKNSAYLLFFFGRTGEGSAVSVISLSALTAVAVILTCYVISRSFRKLATVVPEAKKVKGSTKEIKASGAFVALYKKEMKRFSSSPNYILNCGFGTFFLIAAAIAVLIKGKDFIELVNGMISQFGFDESAVPAVFALILCLLASMNDSAAASVSLEGKNIWILQSAPVKADKILRAKLGVQLTITCIPLLICSVCSIAVLGCSAANAFLLIFLPQTFAFSTACFDLASNLISPNLNWTNEIVPIKQSLCMLVSLFSASVYSIILALAAFFALQVMSAELFLLLAALFTLVCGIVVFIWINKKGAKKFETLS